MSGSRFGGLKEALEAEDTVVPPRRGRAKPTAAIPPTPAGRAKAREGKKAVVGYFSAGVSRALRGLAADEDTTVQALLGEAIDLLMRARNRHPFGER